MVFLASNQKEILCFNHFQNNNHLNGKIRYKNAHIIIPNQNNHFKAIYLTHNVIKLENLSLRLNPIF